MQSLFPRKPVGMLGKRLSGLLVVDRRLDRIDIFRKDNPTHRWDLIEVKQSTAVKDYHADDIALQRYAFSVAGFLNALEHPLYYLDYETIFSTIPLFDPSSPDQQIPFQFSLHIQERPGGAVVHETFLHTHGGDPRDDFAHALIESCGIQGSVIVYNMAFEARINRERATRFPQHAKALGSGQTSGVG